MKLFNIFKKEAKTIAKSNVQTLDKNQLNKVIGGGDDALKIKDEGISKISASQNQQTL